MQNSTPSSPSPAFAGAHYSAPATIIVPDKNVRLPEIDSSVLSFIAAVASLADAVPKVITHIEALYSAATRGWLLAARAAVRQLEELVASGEVHCRRLSVGLAQLDPINVTPGGGQPRTPTVRVKIGLHLAVFLATVVVDVMLLQALARDISPDLASDARWLIPLSALGVLAICALEMYPILRYSDEQARHDFAARFARLLPWATIVLLGALAVRLAKLSENPLGNLLADEPAAPGLVLAIGVFAAQVAAQSVVGAACLLAANRLAFDTRPSRSQANQAYTDLKAQLDTAAQLLTGNQSTLAAATAMVSAIEAERQVLLDRAAAALAAEILERESTRKTIDSMRFQARPPERAATNGHRFVHASN